MKNYNTLEMFSLQANNKKTPPPLKTFFALKGGLFRWNSTDHMVYTTSLLPLRTRLLGRISQTRTPKKKNRTISCLANSRHSVPLSDWLMNPSVELLVILPPYYFIPDLGFGLASIKEWSGNKRTRNSTDAATKPRR